MVTPPKNQKVEVSRAESPRKQVSERENKDISFIEFVCMMIRLSDIFLRQ